MSQKTYMMPNRTPTQGSSFTSQPINIQPKPAQQQSYTNQQVFGYPKNVFKPVQHVPYNKPTPILLCDPILQYPDFDREFNLTIDVSKYAFREVLSQGPTGKNTPTAFANRTLNNSEIHYNGALGIRKSGKLNSNADSLSRLEVNNEKGENSLLDKNDNQIIQNLLENAELNKALDQIIQDTRDDDNLSMQESESTRLPLQKRISLFMKLNINTRTNIVPEKQSSAIIEKSILPTY
ncbi:hypothetical protein ILUMI_13893 [Ignelater luminosus]|uniref:Reverse transcriptase/retrotransposon-derived protein RNase H-like domain-containing protein n=1 Tax=Ignelater luminosus TaxID=2038154 RepID=A0A8K0CWX9_IGNLU|nr:hypothetical protein ILUMI_13893 [Ignelater luminosus]